MAKQRAAVLEELQTEITRSQLEKYKGKELDVLIEEIITAEDDEGLALGRAWFQAPEVDGCVVIRFDSDDKTQLSRIIPGNVVRVHVLDCTGPDLDSRLV